MNVIFLSTQKRSIVKRIGHGFLRSIETGRGVNSFAEAIAGAKRPQHILGEQPEVSRGDPDAVLKAATCHVDLNFETPPYNHNAIEPHAAIAVWDGDDRLTLYDTSQFTVGTAGSVAEIFGLKRENRSEE